MKVKFDPPIQGALVCIVNPSTGEVITGGYTDENGMIHLDVPPGTYDLVVVAENYKMYKETITVERYTQVQVVLAKIIEKVKMYDVDASIKVESISLTLPSIDIKTGISSNMATSFSPTIGLSVSTEKGT